MGSCGDVTDERSAMFLKKGQSLSGSTAWWRLISRWVQQPGKVVTDTQGKWPGAS
jgi:hypothetical protein